MKLQLQGQRLRLRIDEAELERLLAGAAIINAIELGAGAHFRQALSLHAAPQPSLQTTPGEWQVCLPEVRVREYMQRLPCREALAFELACDGGPVVLLQFEVDVRDSLQVRGARRGTGSDGSSQQRA